MSSDSKPSKPSLKTGCLGLIVVTAVVTTMWAILMPEQFLSEYGEAPDPVAGERVGWLEPQNSNYEIREMRTVVAVREGYVTLRRPSGDELTVPRDKYDAYAK